MSKAKISVTKETLLNVAYILHLKQKEDNNVGNIIELELNYADPNSNLEDKINFYVRDVKDTGKRHFLGNS